MTNVKKIGYGIIVFDDVCHLRNITSEIRDVCDHITICLQETSYHGVPIDDKIVDFCNSILDEGLINDIIWFKPDNLHTEEGPAGPRMIETDKRNFILEHLEKEVGCSHTMVTDSDEFYDHDDFVNAVKIIDEHPEMRITYCEYINYYRDYTHLLVWPFRCYVPFLTISSYRFDFKHGSFDKPSDPTRRYLINDTNGRYCLLSFQLIKMHHLSWLRINIRDKVNNWSSKKYFEHIKNLDEMIIDRYENFKDGDNAIIMFNVPFTNVVVNKLSAQYIKPKYPLI